MIIQSEVNEQILQIIDIYWPLLREKKNEQLFLKAIIFK